jgi:WD40 repeat protein
VRHELIYVQEGILGRGWLHWISSRDWRLTRLKVEPLLLVLLLNTACDSNMSGPTPTPSSPYGVIINLDGKPVNFDETTYNLVTLARIVPKNWLVSSAEYARYKIDIVTQEVNFESCSYSDGSVINRTGLTAEVTLINIQTSQTVASETFEAMPFICDFEKISAPNSTSTRWTLPDTDVFKQWLFSVTATHTELPAPALPQGLRLSFQAHDDTINLISYSPDGTRLMTINWKGEIRMWDVIPAEKLFEFRLPSSFVTFSLDGSKLITSTSYNEIIQIWDAVTGRELEQFLSSGAVSTASLSPDAIRFLTSIEQQRNLHSPGLELTSCEFSPTGQTIACNWDSRTSRGLGVWDAITGEVIIESINEGNGSPIYPVSFSPDGTTILTIFNNESIKLWDATTGEFLRALVNTSNALDVAFSSDGRYIAALEGTLRGDPGRNWLTLWDSVTGSKLPNIDIHTSGIKLGYSPNSHEIAVGSDSGLVEIWNISGLVSSSP